MGQWAMNQLCVMIGSPFADDKKQAMQSSGTLLGLTHDLSCINKTGHVRFWARDRLHDKFVKYLPQHVKQAASVEAQHPISMALLIYWNKVSMDVLGMAVFWPLGHARTSTPLP